jgi:uncharacterized membrane protein YobD (UPF0266 family)
MIRNIKIRNIINIIIVSNSMEHGNVFTKKLMKTFILEVFPIFFQSSMGLVKFTMMFFVGPPIILPPLKHNL